VTVIVLTGRFALAGVLCANASGITHTADSKTR